jgi:A/G-specific adenine glycosylase
LPELASGETPHEWCARELGCRAEAARELATIEHSFTHFDLDLTPWLVTLAGSPSVVMDRVDRLWYNPSVDPSVGVPAPVAMLLHALAEVPPAVQRDERQIA